MNCKNCGNQLTGTEKFCNVCGTPVETPAVEPTMAPVEPVVPTEPMMQNDMMNNQNMMMNNQNMMMDNQNMMMNNQNMMMDNQNMMMNNQNPMPDNNVNNNMMPPQQPKKSNVGVIILIILLVLAIGVGGFIGGYYLFGDGAETSEKDKDDDKEDKDDEDEDEEDEDEDNNNDDEDDEDYDNNGGTPIKVGSEVIIIPEEYEVSNSGGNVQFTNGKWVASIAKNTLTYVQTKANIQLLKDEFESRDFNVKVADVTKVNGNEYIEFVLETDQYNMAVLITDYNETCVMVTLISADLFTLNDNWYKDIDEILENSKSVDKSLYPDLEEIPSMDVTDTLK